MLGFFIFLIIGLLVVSIGIYTFFSLKARSYWSNTVDIIHVTDIKKYNHKAGMIWMFYGIWIMVCGIPMLAGQNSPVALFSVVGIFSASIFLIIILMYLQLKYEVK